jgi:cytochrome c2
MKTYFDNYNHIEKYVEMDPKNGQFETCLSCHLVENDVKMQPGNFGYHLIREDTGFIL